MKLLWAVPAVFLLMGSAFADNAASGKNQARDLYYAPPDGWVSTNGDAAFVTIRGQVAEGFFGKMPDSSIVKDSSATCSPEAVVKRVGGMECARSTIDKATSKYYYECEMTIIMSTGQLESSDMCWDPADMREEAKKQGYWIVNKP